MRGGGTRIVGLGPGRSAGRPRASRSPVGPRSVGGQVLGSPPGPQTGLGGLVAARGPQQRAPVAQWIEHRISNRKRPVLDAFS